MFMEMLVTVALAAVRHLFILIQMVRLEQGQRVKVITAVLWLGVIQAIMQRQEAVVLAR